MRVVGGSGLTQDMERLLARVVSEDRSPMVVAGADLSLLYVNDAARSFGWNPEDVVGTCVLDLVHPDDVKRVIAALEVLDAGHPMRSGRLRIMLGNGEYTPFDVSPLVLAADDGPAFYAFSLRPNPFRDAQTLALTEMVAGAPPEQALAVLAAEFSSNRPASVIALDVDGERRVVGPLPGVFAGVVDGVQDVTPGTPWAQALRSDEPVVLESLEGLPDAVVAAAEERGLCAAVFQRADDPGRTMPALVTSWAQDPHVVDMLTLNLRDLDDLVRLALDRRASQERLEHMAHHDPLTDLANRVAFFAAMEAATGGDAPATSVAVAYLDLDDFKSVNDSHGHAAGDAVLVEIGRRFRSQVRTGDLIARLGGDEFGVLLTDRSTDDDAVIVAERLLASTAEPITVDGHEILVRASGGVAVAPVAAAADSDALVRLADDALYRAKRRRKGTLEAVRLDGRAITRRPPDGAASTGRERRTDDAP